jgi:hypothetical protein
MRDQLMKVSRGFKLVYIGLLLVIVAIIGIFVAALLFAVAIAGRRLGVGFMGIALIISMLLLSWAGSITSLIGKVFCLAIPPRAGPAKQLIAVSIALEVVGQALSSLNMLGTIAHLNLDPTISQILSMGGAMLSMSSTVLFLLFTKYAARFIRREDLADTAMSILWLFVTTIGCFLVGTVVMVVMTVVGVAGGAGVGGATVGACFGGLIMLTGLIFALIALIRFISLMKEMNEVVARYAGNIRRTKRTKPKRREPEYEDEDDDEDEDEDDEDEDDEDEDDEDDRRRRRRRNRRFDRD